MGMFLRRGPAPHRTRLYDKAEGSIIKIAESGTPVAFYIAKHNYEAGLNGDGRTLMVRKDCYDSRAFSSSNNAYANSSLSSWLCNTYLTLLDADIQSAIGTTKFYYTPGNGNATVTTLQRAVFQLSLTELGKSNTSAKKEGTALPIASTLQIAYRNGAATTQWTRTPLTNGTNGVFGLTSGGATYKFSYSEYHGSRPAFTLPSDFITTDDMLA